MWLWDGDEWRSGTHTIAVVGVPTITNITPDPSYAGQTVTVAGTNFVTGATTVSVSGSAATSVNVTSATSLTCVLPAHANGDVSVTVTTAGGTSSPWTTLTYQAPSAPTITSIVPNPGPAGAVTVNGTNFISGATVSFGGSAATSVVVVNSGQITCNAPAHADGAVNVTVTTSGGTSGNYSFTYQAATGIQYPRLGGMLIGGSHDYGNYAYQAEIAQLDMAIIGIYNGWTGANGQSPTTAVNQIKAINPDILLGNYTCLNEAQTSGTNMADMRTKLGAEDGPSGIGDWWLYDSAGAHLSAWEGNWCTNLSLITTPDSTGKRYPQWLAGRDESVLYGAVDWDIWYSDNALWRATVDGDWDRNGSNDSATGTAAQNWYRDGYRAYFDTARVLRPDLLVMGNCDHDLDGDIYPAEAVHFDQYTDAMHGMYIEYATGQAWSSETWGGWSTLMDWYHHIFSNLLDPKMVLFSAWMEANPSDYQHLRYSFGACLMDDGYFAAVEAGYGVIYWYDEYDLAGTATTKWLGEAIDGPQTTAWSLGVYRRRFENGMVLVNPKGNGQRTVTVGAGYHRFSGSQAPSVNNGATVTSTVTLADRDGLFLVAD